MISAKDIEKLASLARIEITDEEKEQFGKEIDSILTYVTQIKAAAVSLDTPALFSGAKNVLREDTGAYEPGISTEKILANAPKREGNYLKVKKIL